MQVVISEEQRVELGIPCASVKHLEYDTWMVWVDHRCLRRYKRRAKPWYEPLRYKGAKLYWDKPSRKFKTFSIVPWRWSK